MLNSARSVYDITDRPHEHAPETTKSTLSTFSVEGRSWWSLKFFFKNQPLYSCQKMAQYSTAWNDYVKIKLNKSTQTQPRGRWNLHHSHFLTRVQRLTLKKKHAKNTQFSWFCRLWGAILTRENQIFASNLFSSQAMDHSCYVMQLRTSGTRNFIA